MSVSRKICVLPEELILKVLNKKKFYFNIYNFFTILQGCKRPFLGWGRKKTGNLSLKLGIFFSRPFFLLEDGFIRSLGLGNQKSSSLVVDNLGIYYDATQESALEECLNKDIFSEELLQRSSQAISQIKRWHISKYNHASSDLPESVCGQGKKILVVDQTAGDLSIRYGFADSSTFPKMLQAALEEHPDAQIFLKIHPDVLAGKKQTCFQLDNLDKRVRLISQTINPVALLEMMDHVYVVTSQLGFEALMLGKPVTCFGAPFYAGWGVTDDRASPSLPVFKRRIKRRSVEEIFAVFYILYTHYVHPDYRQVCALEGILDYFSLQKRCFEENKGEFFCLGFTAWKKNYIRHFLRSYNNKIHFAWTRQQALDAGFNKDARLVVWGNRAIEEAEALARLHGQHIWRIEDGFIRSVGLGSDYNAPLSLVLDKQGIYYDPNQPSDLETLCQTGEFSAELLKRADTIRQMLLENAISKYNLGGAFPQGRLAVRDGQKIILVPGQVEDDASIRKGCRDVDTNAALLCATRQARPDDYIIYKPHPDVVSGNRVGHVPTDVLERCCDLVLEDVSITDCLEVADEIHTMTSLVGFEGLLRKMPVTCYGLPFYAGWGLTDDRHAISRRTRRLSLEQLVAATLILYPRYINWTTGVFTTPEFAIQTLRRQLDQQGGKRKNKISWIRRQLRKLVLLCQGVFHFG